MATLHRLRTLPALMPRYVERFRCIGPSCEDTCCSGWSVHIDKKTYDAYRSESIPILRQVASSLVRTEGAPGDAMYATIAPVGEQQNCAAFQGGSCTVHANLGESYLADLCHTYPRVNRSVNGQFEQAVSLSCPEAARLALLADDAFEFVEAPVSVREATVQNVAAAGKLSAEAMNEARFFCLNLMRTRDLALWQRMALLGAFCDALARHRASEEHHLIPALVEEFTRLIEHGDLTATLDLIQPDHAAQAMVFATLWSAKGFVASSPFQQALIHQLSHGLGADENGQVSAVTLVDGYKRGLARLDEALQSAPWLLEHYVVNEMFTQLTPFNGEDSYDSYLELAARFGLLRLLLAAQCNGDGALPPMSTLISTVHLHCRRFQHDTVYTARVKRSLQESGWAKLDKLYTLLRA